MQPDQEERVSEQTRAWEIYVCPGCARWTSDPDQIECECADEIEAWDAVTVVPLTALQQQREALEVAGRMANAADDLTSGLDAFDPTANVLRNAVNDFHALPVSKEERG